MATKPNVIIVGAGASGIAAAVRLYENGIDNITILEAENRIGGRINSVEYGGSVVDLGGQWCHGEKDNIVYEMVKDLNLLSPSHNDYQDNTYYLPNGTVVDKDTTDELYKICTEIVASSREHIDETIFGNYFITEYKKRVEEKFTYGNERAELFNSFLEWYEKVFNCLHSTESWNDVSLRGANDFVPCEGNAQLNWRNRGYRTILDVLMKKIPDSKQRLPIDERILLNKRVSKIIWDAPNGILVNCSDGTFYSADHVIITVSLGVLKDIYQSAFVPDLPTFKRSAIEGMSFGTVNKILLKFPIKWWSDDVKGFSLLWNDADRRSMVNEFPQATLASGELWLEDINGFYVIDSHPNILLGWSVGKTAVQLENLSDQIVIDGCMYLLRKFLGNKYEIPQPDSVLRTKWKNNPNFKGSYVYHGIVAERKKTGVEDLARPIIFNGQEVLLFAGEGTHPKYFSTVNGAIETGFREADRLLKKYNKPNHYEIAVIGAGIAGLAAANRLLELGHKNIVILEAQNRVGGRIHTMDWNEGVLELGAQWIHHSSSSLYELALRHNLIDDNISEEGLGIFIRDNGEIIDEWYIKQVDFEVGKILEKCEKFVDATLYPNSVGEFLEEKFMEYLNESDDDENIKLIKLELLDWHLMFQTIDNSCRNMKCISAREWGKYICTGDQAHINLKNGGYKSLIDILVGRLPADLLKLSSQVKEIDYRKETTELNMENGSQVVCDYLICTCSLGVLKESNLFLPSLPSPWQKCINDMGFYGIGKIFLIFSCRWWKVDGFQFVWRRNTSMADEEGWLRCITGFESVFNQPNVLVGWVGGDGVEVMERMEETRIGEQCIGLLRRFITDSNVPDPVKVIKTRWSLNPFVRGAYSHTTPACDVSGLGARQLTEPISVNGKFRILFAGEAVHENHYATTHGAFESGQQQASLLHDYILSISNKS